MADKWNVTSKICLVVSLIFCVIFTTLFLFYFSLNKSIDSWSKEIMDRYTQSDFIITPALNKKKLFDLLDESAKTADYRNWTGFSEYQSIEKILKENNLVENFVFFTVAQGSLFIANGDFYPVTIISMNKPDLINFFTNMVIPENKLENINEDTVILSRGLEKKLDTQANFEPESGKKIYIFKDAQAMLGPVYGYPVIAKKIDASCVFVCQSKLSASGFFNYEPLTAKNQGLSDNRRKTTIDSLQSGIQTLPDKFFFNLFSYEAASEKEQVTGKNFISIRLKQSVNNDLASAALLNDLQKAQENPGIISWKDIKQNLTAIAKSRAILLQWIIITSGFLLLGSMFLLFLNIIKIFSFKLDRKKFLPAAGLVAFVIALLVLPVLCLAFPLIFKFFINSNLYQLADTYMMFDFSLPGFIFYLFTMASIIMAAAIYPVFLRKAGNNTKQQLPGNPLQETPGKESNHE